MVNWKKHTVNVFSQWNGKLEKHFSQENSNSKYFLQWNGDLGQTINGFKSHGHGLNYGNLILQDIKYLGIIFILNILFPNV